MLCSAAAARAQTVKLAQPEEFKPVAEYSDTVAKCDTMRALGPLREGEHGYRLIFGSNPAHMRQAGAVWDTTGHLRTYSDIRGDLRGPPTPIAQRGPRTSIVIDFQQHMVLAINRERDMDRALELIFDTALVSPHLGSPVAIIDRLHRQCGAPAYGNSDEMR